MTTGSDWLYIVDPSLSGSRNMAIDEGLLQWLERCPDPSTIVRFYTWNVSTVSVGRNQRRESTIDVHYCEDYRIPVVCRPTGGRAVFHADELTYAVVSNDTRYFPLWPPSKIYFRIASGLQKGLELVGVKTDLASRSSRSLTHPRTGRARPCFLSHSRYELLSQDRKIVGSSQKRLTRSFLQHGSIPLRLDYPTMAAALDTPEDQLKGAVISVAEASRRSISFEVLAQALKSAFEEVFRVRLTPNPSLHPLIAA